MCKVRMWIPRLYRFPSSEDQEPLIQPQMSQKFLMIPSLESLTQPITIWIDWYLLNCCTLVLHLIHVSDILFNLLEIIKVVTRHVF